MKKLTILFISLLVSFGAFAQEGTGTYNPISENNFSFWKGFGWISFLPLVMGVIMLVLLLVKLNSYNLKEALSTDHDPKNRIPSASRLVAFISGISAILFSFCIFVFYTLVYIKTGEYPDIEPLTNSLLALGIGVVPYSINKVTGAIERRNQPNKNL